MAGRNTADVGFEKQIWNVIAGNAHSATIGDTIDNAMRVIEKGIGYGL